jgi:mRNA-degrading endonuclease toxin of MazEF toxin-antitoxin module
LSTEDELPRACAINLDVITTIPKECLSQKITLLKPEKLMEVDKAIRFALGFTE